MREIESFVDEIDGIRSSGYLNEGASLQQVKSIEEYLSVELPDQVLSLYKKCNGELESEEDDFAGIFLDLRLISLDQVIAYHKRLSSLDEGGSGDNSSDVESVPPGFVRAKFFDRKWMPIAVGDSSLYMAVDFSPGELGQRGQVILFGRDLAPYVIRVSSDLRGVFEELMLCMNRASRSSSGVNISDISFLEYLENKFLED